MATKDKVTKTQTRAAFVGFILITLIAVIFIYFQSRTGPGQPIPPEDTNQTTGGAMSTPAPTPGVTITLSDGNAALERVEPLTVVNGVPLTEEEINAILARLPNLAPLPGEQVTFRLPEEVLPPPRTGATIEESFPPPPGNRPASIEYGPLEVLRFSPEGEVPIAPFVNVTFNQPMVQLGTLKDLSQEEVPVVIEPAIPGTWRWLGTKTINFQYDSDLIDRIPMATEFTVTVPAGTESAVGGTLAKEFKFTFRTPPPRLQSSYPYSSEPQSLDPFFFIAFDQRIDPAAVLETIQVEADGNPVLVRLALEEEITEDESVQNLIEYTPKGRWLVFRAKESLPKDSIIRVEIGPETPSAEGPLVTKSTQTYSFHTYAPLKVEEHGCSWYGDECPPLSPFYIRFNNPLDSDAYDESMLLVEPEIPGVSVNIIGDTISIRGATVGRTTYRVAVGEGIQDVFGQTLGKKQELTFQVGPAEPYLRGPDSNFVTVDPASSKPTLSLYVMNYKRLDVQIYAVQPSDWDDFRYFLQEYQRTDRPPMPPGELIRDEVLRMDNEADVLTEVNIDLSRDLEGGFGHFFVIVKPPKELFENERYWEHVLVWVQVTQIGLDAFVDHSDMVVWATDLRNGTPIQELSIRPSAASGGVTGADGVTRFPIPASGANYITAQQGGDVAILPATTYIWDQGGWAPRSPIDTLRWYVIDDRAMYRPREEVHLKGWVRLVGGKQDGDVVLVGEALTHVTYQIYDPQGNDLGSGQAEVNALGGFDFNFTLPERTNLGYARVELTSNADFTGRYYSHSFQIQEFRRPEFEVNARNESTGPYFADGEATVAVEAKYYVGGPLPNADVTWQVTSTPTNYNPPNWPDFTFGVWQPWWWFYNIDRENDGESQTFTGKTDASGTHYLNMDFTPDGTMRPFSVLAEATVMDINRQAWSGTAALLVHPGDLYIGMRSERYFVERGEPLEIYAIVTDLDGLAIPERELKITAARLDWKFQDGEWNQIEVDPQECRIKSADEPVTCEFETPVGGRYRITAVVFDEQGRGNKTVLTRWVSGGDLPPSRDVEQEEATLIPDKEVYQPGETAEILVQSPFSPAEGLLTVSRSGFIYKERFTIEDGSITLKLPITEAYIPNLNVQVDLVGSAARTDDQGESLANVPDRPAFARGNLILNIPPLVRTMKLSLEPRTTALEPGGRTTLDVALRDADGNPVQNAELAVLVVDESVLALTGYQLTDPISVFYSNRPSEVNSTYIRSTIILANPLEFGAGAGTPTPLPTMTADDAMQKGFAVEEAMEMPMAAAPAEGELGRGGEDISQPQIPVRMNFDPLATFAPEVRTDARGEASITIRLPDNLTRYRIMAVAVDSRGSRFGSAESNITARLPLMVRPSPPRFLNFGDSFELPIVLQNQTDESMSVDVAIQFANINVEDIPGMRVTVPENDRIEVRFPVSTDSAGTARFQVAAVSDKYADAASGDLIVYTPATTEAFATYGVIDEGAIAQPVKQPTDVYPQFGGLEIQTSSTALQSLTDAIIYLVNYPYECSEQIASRILGVAALRDVLKAFEAEGLPSPEEMEAVVDRDLTRLESLQNWDGGFPIWRRGQDSIPFYTIHAAHAMARAELKGYRVSSSMKENVLLYLVEIESHYPHWYSLRTRWTLSAYALYVRDLMGDNDPAKARQLLSEATLEGVPLEAVGWIWQVLVNDPNSEPELESIRRFVANRVVETAEAANFTTDYDDQNYLILGSNRRADAVLLDALIADDPNADLIPKLVKGLLAHRKQGHWRNTQENVFVLLALDRYFNIYESQTPDFVARIWLGDIYTGSHVYEGFSTERHETVMPMNYLLDVTESDEQDLIVQKEGVGRLYYRLGLKYAPTDLWLDPLDMGFVIQREYEAVDDPEDVYRDEDGVWHIRAGTRVRVRITMVADTRRYHVALVDPLPAGLEIINPSLVVSQSIPQDPESPDYEYGWWWWRTWYEHQNLRDERAEAFTTLLWDGVYDYTYIARATTPGKFIVPPVKAEEMYSPEVFGRSGSDWVLVE